MTGFSLFLIFGVLGLGITAGSISLILCFSRSCKPSGRERELHHTHQKSISRFGGVGLAFGFVVAALTYLYGGVFLQYHPEECWNILASSMAMFALGLWDDLQPIGARRKLAGQLVVASAACYSGINIHVATIPFAHASVELGFWAWPVTVLWLVAMTNLINLIDGVDGLAGGISMMLMILLACFGTQGNSVSLLAASMIGSLLAFLWFNFPPARIYMGDGGAYFLGFLIGCLTIVSSHKGTIFSALIAPLFVLALPILDTSIAILRRGLQGLPLFRPDRKHIHHRLLDAGLSRRNVVLGAYVFTAFFLVLGFAALWTHGEQLPVLIGFGALFILLAAGKFSFSREWLGVGHVLGNSLSARAEIQYALAQTHWLILEAARCQNLESLCDDTLFAARKIGFTSVQIKLDGLEKNWRCSATDKGKDCWILRQHLPDRTDGYIEIAASAPAIADGGAISNKHNFEILSDLLAEGWIKAVIKWEKLHGQSVRK